MIWSTQDQKEQAVVEGIKNNANNTSIVGDCQFLKSYLFIKTIRIWSKKVRVERQNSALTANILTLESLAISSGNRYIALGLSNLTIGVCKLQA